MRPGTPREMLERQFPVTERVSLMCEQALALARQPSAFLDADETRLESGEQAMVPVIWTGMDVKDDTFLCDSPPFIAGDLEVLPGICSVEDSSSMLCLLNRTVDTIVLERGEVVALGYEVPPNTRLEKKPRLPQLGRERESIVFENGKWEKGIWRSPVQKAVPMAKAAVRGRARERKVRQPQTCEGSLCYSGDPLGSAQQCRCRSGFQC